MSEKSFAIALLFTGICAATALPAQAERPDMALLVKSLSAASVSLDQGLKASEAQGKPISGKFELENGVLQLSVYVTKKGKFSEIVVDHESRSVSKTEPITEGGDFKDANAQSKAMAKAKISLEKAVQDTVTARPGYRALSAVPTLKAGHPVAEITLVNGADIKTISRPLD